LELAQIRLAAVDGTAHAQPTRQIHGVARYTASTEGSFAQRHRCGGGKAMLSDQCPRGIAKRYAVVHRVRRK